MRFAGICHAIEILAGDTRCSSAAVGPERGDLMKLRRSKRLYRAAVRNKQQPDAAGRRLVRLVWSTAGAAAMLSGGFAFAQVSVHAGLPAACPGGGSSCKGLPFIGSAGAGSSLLYGPNRLTVNQAGSSAIYNWASFNIAAGNTVQFIQPSTSSVALNRIFDPNVSTISGNLLSNGQIYLINPNGILFGKGANVNVGGLIASTLDINDSAITGGLLSGNNVAHPNLSAPIFSNDGSIVPSDLAASPGANPAIVVQSGATLYSAGRSADGTVVSAGRIFLFAPTVENSGKITVDGGGQVILGAGSSVYLGSSSDASLRGLLVEVAGKSNAVTVDPTGSIQVGRGNITLMGLAVNQNGALTATSALDENGSIRLVAREVDPTQQANLPVPVDKNVLVDASVTGAVSLGSGSKTVVSVDTSDTSTLPLNDPTALSLRSTIDIQGASVTIGGNGAPGSTLVQAHGGDITVTARQASAPLAGGSTNLGDGSLLGTGNAASIIHVGADAKIDASGLQDVQVDGARNFVFISRLTSNNLANAPYQRTGFLLGQGVYVNLATAPSWIDVSNLQAAVSGTQAERNTVAGTVSLRAEGSVVLAKGSVVDVSGGSIAYTAAIGRTSQLITALGTVVDISNASPDVQYLGFSDQGSTTLANPREGITNIVTWQAPTYTQVGGYTQGQSAGTIQIYAPAATLNGSLVGQTTSGAQQRGAPPPGGKLQIGSNSITSLDTEAVIQRANILLGPNASALENSLTAAQAADTIVVDTGSALGNGINRFDLTSDGTIEIAGGATAPLNLGAGGQLIARANAIAVNASIVAPGGTVSLSERPLTGSNANSGGITSASPWNLRNSLAFLDLAPNAQRGSIALAAGTQITVAGTWTNDYLTPAPRVPGAPIVLNGGSITLSGRVVDISGAAFDVSGGANLSQAGTFSGGAAGKLSVKASFVSDGTGGDPSRVASTAQLTDTGVLDLGANFASRIRGFGVSGGGSLVLAAPSLAIGDSANGGAGSTQAPTPLAPLDIPTSVGHDGFSNFGFTAFDSIEVVGSGFTPLVQTLQDNALLAARPSAGSLLAVTNPQGPLPGQAAPAQISFSATNTFDGRASVAAGALVDAGVQGKVSISAGANIQDDGVLRAPAGTVALSLGTRQIDTTFGYDGTGGLNDRAIQLGPTAQVDVSGTSLAVTNAQGVKAGQVLDAGTFSANAPLGTVAIDSGASISAHGTVDTVDILIGGSTYQRQPVASQGGIVQISATNGLFLEGSVDARGGAATAGGGWLSVALLAQSSVPSNTVNPGSVLQAVGAQLVQNSDLAVTSAPPALSTAQGSFASLVSSVDAAGNALAAAPVQGAVTPAWVNTSTSGFDHVWLQAPDSIVFSQANLAVRGSLVLSAQALRDTTSGASVTLAAPYIALGTVAQLSPATLDVQFPYNTHAASAGTATISIDGSSQVDLVGNLALNGFGNTRINSLGDVRGIGVTADSSSPISSRTAGSLNFSGSLDIAAAQVYPATQTDFVFASADPAGGSVNIAVPTNPAIAPWSAGGSLDFRVGSFDNAGRVVAPQGSISVEGTNITLESASLLSAAGSVLVPYGTVLSGVTWTYANPPNNTSIPIAPFTLGSAAGAAIPGKGISLTASTIDAKAGSTIDISGGGDVLGTGFVPGPGGTYDMSLNFPYATSTNPVLASTRNPFFALVPSRGTASAPFDTQIYTDLVLNAGLPSSSSSAFQMGETITIGAGSSIAAGTYTVMPVRYALLPGAYAVEAAAGFADIQPNASVSMPDGTAIVAGKLGVAAAGTITARWSGFRVYSDTQFRTLSEFHDYLGSQFFAASASNAGQTVPQLGPDAGTLQVDATQAIALGSTIAAAPAAGGRGADVALDAPAVVVAPFAADAASPQATLTLGTTGLTALHAESLVIGATIEAPGPVLARNSARNLSAVAASVGVSGGASIQAGEIILAGTTVNIGAGSSIIADPTVAPPTRSISVAGDGTALGDGALVYAGNVATLPALKRNGSAPGTATSGDLAIGANATVRASSVLFDASNTQSYDPSFTPQSRDVGLSAALVNLGAVPAGASGLNLNQVLLSKFSAAGSLTLSSLGGFEVYGAATIGQLASNGAPLLSSLALVGPGLIEVGGGTAQVALNAGHIRLENSPGLSLASPGSGQATLLINAVASASAASTAVEDGSVAIGGALAFDGFQSVVVDAAGRAASPTQTAAGTGDLVFTGAVGAGSGITLGNAGATLNVSATRITAQRGVDAGIVVPGALTISASGNAAPAQSGELGASLNISAQNVNLTGRIDLPSGVVAIQANGPAASDGITVGSGAAIRVAGSTQTFGATTADVSAGSIQLNSANGSILQAAGSTIDISGSGIKGDAGALKLGAASGTVQLGGTVLMAPGSAARGADVNIDAARLDNFSALVSTIDAGGGGVAADALSLRARSGDIAIGSGDAIKAHAITVEADGGGGINDGSIVASGTLDASGAAGGQVNLYANDQIALLGAQILANATSAGQTGGSVVVSSRVTADASARIARNGSNYAVVFGADPQSQRQTTIDVSAPGSAGPLDPAGYTAGGIITLRTRQINGNDVDIAGIGQAALLGARQDAFVGVYVDNAAAGVDAGAEIAAMAGTLSSYMSAANRAAMTNRLLGGAAPGAAFSLRPGLEIRSPGQILVSTAVDFAAGLTATDAANCTTCTFRYTGSTAASDPGELTLRATGNIAINANVSDGFLPGANARNATALAGPGAPNVTPWSSGESWSYTVTAGADLLAADPNRVAASAQVAGQAGDLSVGPTAGGLPVTVRTGTGTIALNAARDLIVSNTPPRAGSSYLVSSAVYSAGVANISIPASVQLPSSALFVPGISPLREPATVPYLTQFGGNVSIVSGNDIVSGQDAVSQTINDWLLHAGLNSQQASPAGPWGILWVDFGQFQQGFGALGGGNLALLAGNNITGVGAAVASNRVNSAETGGQTVTHGVGSLSVEAGGTVQQGTFYDESGLYRIQATALTSASTLASPNPDVRLALGSNALDIQVREGAQFESPFNPAIYAYSDIVIAAKPIGPLAPAVQSMYFTYDDSSTLNVRAAAGDVLMGSTVISSITSPLVALGGSVFGLTVARNGDVLPPNVSLVAFGGNVRGPGPSASVEMYPSASGQLQLLADGAISGFGITMSPALPGSQPGIASAQPALEYVGPGSAFLASPVGPVLHAGDGAPAQVVARNGSISDSDIVLSKTLDMQAGGNIGPNVTLDVQNSNADSVTSISTGGMIDFSANSNAQQFDHIFISGPGAAQVVAAGAINLGADGLGIDSRGNLDNPNLPAVGASLVVVAGAGSNSSGGVALPNYLGIIDNFVRYDAFASFGSASAVLDAQVIAALRNDPGLVPLANALAAGMANRNSVNDPWSAFQRDVNALSPAVLAVGAVKLASAVQVVANQQFVLSNNSETFAPAYAVFGDMFSTLQNNDGAIRQFILDNPFGNASNAAALRSQALAGLPAALVAAIELGIAAPSSVNNADSAFSKALSAIDPATLSSGARALLANTLSVAGASRDALAASGSLTGSGSPYAKGLTSLAASFTPTTAAGLNDLQMGYNEIKAEQSGSVAVFAPQGGIIVGQSAPPVLDTTAKLKTPSQLGIFTYGGGDIIGMVRDNFDVFRSRVFTLAGGDINLWSSLGNIDAGHGARDVAVVPPPNLVQDPNTGIVSLDFGASVSGSGIGALKTQAVQPPSNINLMAPAGYVDAGEAGIRAEGGSVTLGTNLVLNAGNIQAASGVSGGAVVATVAAPPPPSTGTSGGDKVAEGAQRDAMNQARDAEARANAQAHMHVTGEFIGFDDDCGSHSAGESEKCRTASDAAQ